MTRIGKRQRTHGHACSYLEISWTRNVMQTGGCICWVNAFVPMKVTASMFKKRVPETATTSVAEFEVRVRLSSSLCTVTQFQGFKTCHICMPSCRHPVKVTNESEWALCKYRLKFFPDNGAHSKHRGCQGMLCCHHVRTAHTHFEGRWRADGEICFRNSIAMMTRIAHTNDQVGGVAYFARRRNTKWKFLWPYSTNTSRGCWRLS